MKSECNIITSDRRQSKTLLTINERESKIDRNSVFDCHLSPVGRQMAIKNFASTFFWSTFVNSINIFICHLSGVIIVCAHVFVVVFSLRWCFMSKSTMTHYQLIKNPLLFIKFFYRKIAFSKDGFDMVLDCIDSWSLSSSLLCFGLWKSCKTSIS